MSKKWNKGRVINDRYEIFDIKKGGMGVVFICYDIVEKTMVVLKTFRNQYLANNQIIKRFLKEAEIWIHLELHPNIVRAYSIDFIHNRPFIKMEYIATDHYCGLNLEDYIARRCLNLKLIIDFAVQFCEGMIYAQQKLNQLGNRFVHADIKPANILIQNQKILKITDFGLSHTHIDHHATITWGTLAYMSPEQFVKKPLDVRSDIYSFGCVLYEMVTGKRPFVIRENTNDKLRRNKYYKKHCKETPVKPNKLRNDCPLNLNKLILLCLKKKPSKRIPNFKVLKERLLDIYAQITGKNYRSHAMLKNSMNNIDIINKGISLCEIEKYTDSILCMNKILKSDAQLVYKYTAYCCRGTAAFELGRTEDALYDYHEAIQIFPDKPFAYNHRANLYNNLGEMDKALSDYDMVIALDDEYGIGYYNRGLCHIRLSHLTGHLEKALSDFNAAVELGHYEAYTNLGGTYHKLGKRQDALEYYHKAIDLYPRNPIVYTNAGSVYVEMAMVEEAEEYFNLAILINPQFLLAYSNRAGLYAGQGRYHKAIVDYEKAISIEPSKIPKEFTLNYGITEDELKTIYPVLLHDCGVAHLKLGNLEEARDYLSRFLKKAIPFYADKIGQVIKMLTWIDQQLENC